MHSCRRSLKIFITFVNIVTGIAEISHCMASFNSGIVHGLSWYTLDFRYPLNKKSQGLISGERGGNRMSPFLDIEHPVNVSQMTFIETLAV